MKKLALLLFLVPACGSDEADPTLVPPPSCGDVRGTLTSRGQAIVNGSATHDDTLVDLSAGQILAIGAVMGDYGGWDNFCTGTLVARDVVLTAAHCVYDEGTGEDAPASEMRFAFGGDAYSPAALMTLRGATSHPSYDPYGDATHDIAVLVLSEPAVNQLPAIVPLQHNCTPLPGLGFQGEMVQNVGFGCVDSDCSAVNSTRWWAVEEVIATTGFDFTVDGHGDAGVCFGDSGGPTLWTMPDGEIRVMGVLSWGDAECGNQDHFANLVNECPFIENYLPACGAVDEVGTCTGDVATWCNGTSLVEIDCSQTDRVCGADGSGNMRCLDLCQGETAEGRCDERNNAVWCENGRINVRNCTACNQQCGWSSDRVAYYCL